MKVMITGCLGQVGHCLTEQANAAGYTTLAVDYQELDITDRTAVMHLVTTFSPNVIINAAAHTAVDRAEGEEQASYAINRDGPTWLAQAAQACGAILLHISTDYVFRGDKEGLYQEQDAVSPQGVYGASKLAGELAVAEHCRRHLILRTAWVFGEHGNNFVKTMLRLGMQRPSLGIVADQFGGPTFAGDIAQALLTMARQAHEPDFHDWGIYHFAGEPHVSWFQFADHIFSAAQQQALLPVLPTLSALSTEEYPTPARRPQNSRLDCRRIEHRFGILPSNWQQALHDLTPYLPRT